MNKEDFTKKLYERDMKDIDDEASPWGNVFYTITRDQLEKLKAGKVLTGECEEYGVFIILGDRNDR
jgi:hypothetical protein